MDKARKKRFQRIESLDQKQLDALTVELKKQNQTLVQRTEIRDSMLERLEALLEEQRSLETIALKTQANDWANRIQSNIESLDQHLDALKKQRDEQLDEVQRQKARVRGWTLLLEKIKTEELETIEKEAMSVADDRVLGKLSVETRSSK